MQSPLSFKESATTNWKKILFLLYIEVRFLPSCDNLKSVAQVELF